MMPSKRTLHGLRGQMVQRTVRRGEIRWRVGNVYQSHCGRTMRLSSIVQKVIWQMFKPDLRIRRGNRYSGRKHIGQLPQIARPRVIQHKLPYML